MNYRQQNKATLKDVAREAGVAPITVSRFVNDPKQVSEKAVARIVAAIEKTGYVPNAAARQLKTAHSNIVFFIVPNIRNELYASLSHELMLKLSRHKKSLFICDYNFQDELEEMLILEVLKHRPAAIVMASGDGITLEQIMLLKSSRIPVIQFDRINGAIDSAVNLQLDNYRGGVLAAEYLISKGVKRVVAYSGDTKRVFSARIEGLKDTLNKQGITLQIIEAEMGNNATNEAHPLDTSGDAGYFLLNSDIASRFFALNTAMMTTETAERIICFDHLPNGDFLPFPIATIDYDKSVFVSQILTSLTQVFDGETVQKKQLQIPVKIAKQG